MIDTIPHEGARRAHRFISGVIIGIQITQGEYKPMNLHERLIRNALTSLSDYINQQQQKEEEDGSTELDEMFEDPLDQLRGLSIDKPEPENKK